MDENVKKGLEFVFNCSYSTISISHGTTKVSESGCPAIDSCVNGSTDASIAWHFPFSASWISKEFVELSSASSRSGSNWQVFISGHVAQQYVFEHTVAMQQRPALSNKKSDVLT